MDKLKTIQMNSGYIHADETTLQVLNEKNKKAKNTEVQILQNSSIVKTLKMSNKNTKNKVTLADGTVLHRGKETMKWQ